MWLRVEKLDWDASLGIIKNQMSLDEGLANKLNHVGEARWQELFDETNGSPLALVHTLGLMRVRAALSFDSALEMLRGNRDEDLQRFIFQEAHKELTENDKIALSALSFFVSSATFEAWKEIANLSRNALETTIDRLSALSLVDILAGEERYTLHPLTRAFVRGELLAEVNVTRNIELQFAYYWANFASKYGFTNYDAYNQLESEWTNISIAMDILWDYSNAQSDSQTRKQAIDTLHTLAALDLRRFLDFSSRSTEIIQLNSRAYELSCEVKKWSDAGWHAYDVAFEYYYRGQMDSAEEWITKCEEALGHGAEKRELALVAQLRGNLAKASQNYDLANQLFKKAIEYAREENSPSDIALALADLGGLAKDRGDFGHAENCYREALEYAEEDGFEPILGGCLTNLGFLAFDRGNTIDAIQWLEKALPVVRLTGERSLNALVAFRLSLLQQKDGRVDLALPLAQEALKIYQQLQHPNLEEARELVDVLKKAEEGKS